jgi:hypothetical protein
MLGITLTTSDALMLLDTCGQIGSYPEDVAPSATWLATASGTRWLAAFDVTHFVSWPHRKVQRALPTFLMSV